MAENLSRFQVVRDRSAMASPACSLFNRSDSEEWYIWTGTFVDEGAIYIGETDFNDLASVVGYVAPDRFNRLVKAYKKLKEENELLVSRISSISGLGDSLRAMLEAIEGNPTPTTTELKRDPGKSEQHSGTESEADRLTQVILSEALGSSDGTTEQVSVS